MEQDVTRIIPPGANIKVIGVGGGGGNAVNTMIRSSLDGVEFIAANTDVQALRFALPNKKIQVGKQLTKGLGAGADPDVGRDAALEDRHEIQEALSGSDMVFITAGMGGGTGTGGAAVIAQIARELGALTVAVVTKPFNFEGKRRRKHADMGIERLRDCVDTLITIPNQRLLQIATPDLSMVDAFRMADEVLVNAVKGISDIINIPGTVNVDFADVKTVMSNMGLALMGIGRASGENRAVVAARQAICSPLLEDVDIEGATGILINITASSNLTLMEVNEACSIIQDAAHEDANIIFGAVIDENCGPEIRVTVIATGFPAEFEEDRADELFAAANNQKKSTIHRPGQAFSARYDTQMRPSISQPRVATTSMHSSQIKHTVSGASALRREVEYPQRTAYQAPQTQFNQVFAGATTRESVPLVSQPVVLEAKNIQDNAGETEDLVKMTFATPQAPVEIAENETLLETKEQDLVLGYSAEEEEKLESHSAAELAALEEELSLEKSLEITEPAPLDTLFAQEELELAEISETTGIATTKIDEALKLSDSIKGATKAEGNEDDDLEIPAFLRSGMRDLSLD